MSITPAQAAAVLQKEVREIQTVRTATHSIAFVEVMGESSEGIPFNYSLTFDHNDPEFVQMLNDYGARKSAEIIRVMDECAAMQNAVGHSR